MYFILYIFFWTTVQFTNFLFICVQSDALNSARNHGTLNQSKSKEFNYRTIYKCMDR